MSAVRVERLVFTFDETVDPHQYDRAGTMAEGWPRGKAVDVVANGIPAPPALVWLVEAKDFRVITGPPRHSNVAGLAPTVNAKVRDTLAGLSAIAAGPAANPAHAHATDAIAARAHRVVLHLEPHTVGGGHSHLFPHGFAADVLMKLKQLVRDVDPKPLVLNIRRTTRRAGVPWTVR